MLHVARVVDYRNFTFLDGLGIRVVLPSLCATKFSLRKNFLADIMADTGQTENCINENHAKTADDLADDVKERAEELKEKANDFFKSKQLPIYVDI